MKLFSALSLILFYVSAYICLPVILVVLTLDVSLRFGWNAPLRWAQELASILLFASIVLALPYSWLRYAHIRADFLQNILSHRLREVVARFSWLSILTISLLIAWQCWKDMDYMLLINESTPELFVPMAALRAMLALGAIVSALVAIMKLIGRRSLADEAEEISS